LAADTSCQRRVAALEPISGVFLLFAGTAALTALAVFLFFDLRRAGGVIGEVTVAVECSGAAGEDIDPSKRVSET
jgi:hypothetical protein